MSGNVVGHESGLDRGLERDGLVWREVAVGASTRWSATTPSWDEIELGG